MKMMMHGGAGLRVGSLSAATIRPPSTTTTTTTTSSKRRKWKWSSPHKIRISCQIELKPPPYPMDGLEPHMSCETLQLHWGRHHRTHVDILNRQIAGTHLDSMTLPDILAASYNNNDNNNDDNNNNAYHHAAQIWNHDFFWQSMKPGGGGRPSPSACGVLVELIHRDFGSFDAMLNQLTRAATAHFGSGWAWLVYKANRLQVENAVNPRPSPLDNKIVVTTTPNAVNPLLWDYSPLLAIDIWEHAYYLDYENRRGDYVSIFMEKLVSWEVVNSRLEIAMAQAERAREQEKREEEAEMGDGEAVEMYLDSENDDSEAE